MLKKKLFWFVFLFAVILLPKHVMAEDSTVAFTTTIENWKNSSDLRFVCGSNGYGISPTVYYGVNGGSFTELTGQCSFSLASLNYSNGSTFVIKEVYDFASYQGSAPEYETLTITPGSVISDSIDYDDDLYMFGEYITGDQDVTVYILNQLDAEDNPTGTRYVSEAYFRSSDGSSKTETMSLGTIYIPSYCVNLNFRVKGSIANTYGDFAVNHIGTGASITDSASNGDALQFCEIDGLSITKAQFDEFTNGDGLEALYSGVNRADDYEISIDSKDDGINVGSGEFETTMDIIARLDSDGSPTGLLYRVFPFFVLMALVAIGYVVIHKNKVKE